MFIRETDHFVAVGGEGDHIDVREAAQKPVQPLANEAVIVCEQYANHSRGISRRSGGIDSDKGQSHHDSTGSADTALDVQGSGAGSGKDGGRDGGASGSGSSGGGHDDSSSSGGSPDTETTPGG